MTRKVAIVGFATNHRHLAPLDDPDWEIWTLNNAYGFLPMAKAHRWFELHSPWIYEWEHRRGPGHVAALAQFPGPVYLLEARPDIPTSVRFPIEEVVADVGTYLTSSIAYMLGMAIHERVDVIGIWGVDMATNTEYAEQRPACEYLIGMARGRGIEVILPENCVLLSGELYGRGWMNDGGERLTPKQLTSRLTALQKREAELTNQHAISAAQLERLRGAQMELKFHLAVAPATMRETMTQRVKQMELKEQELANNLSLLTSHLELAKGAIMETRYWIGTTPEGQPQETMVAHAG